MIAGDQRTFKEAQIGSWIEQTQSESRIFATGEIKAVDIGKRGQCGGDGRRQQFVGLADPRRPGADFDRRTAGLALLVTAGGRVELQQQLEVACRRAIEGEHFDLGDFLPLGELFDI